MTKEEQLEAYKMFFAMFNVAVMNPDGTYKPIQIIFEEACNNLFR